MNFHPVASTVSEILTYQNKIIIPDFQRSFSWESKQSSTLLNDLLFNLQIEGNTIRDAQYYLGTMIFIKEDDRDSRENLSCIDGQQRLTTLTILLSALGDTFKAIQYEQQAEKIFDFIIPNDNDGNPVKIIENEANYPYFYDFIQSRDKDQHVEPTTSQERLILKTYQDFRKQLGIESFRRKLKDSIYGIEYFDILKALREQILKTTVIRIVSSDRSSANKIFESINSRGKPLSSIDLIKSCILGTINDIDNHERAYTHWKKIIRTLSDSKHQIPDETFFMHYWSSKYKKESSSRLYNAFIKEYGESSVSTLLEFLRNTETESERYRSIVKPNLDRDFHNKKQYVWFIQSMQALNEIFNITQSRIAILSLLDLFYRDSNHSLLSLKNLKSVIKFIENFHFVFNGLMSYRASRVEPLYSRFAIALRKSTNQTDSLRIIKNDLCTPLKKLLPEESVFIDNFVLKLTYSNRGMSSPQQSMLSKYVIYRLWSNANGNEVFPPDGSIEHIIPESSGEEYCNIGNLIVLESNLNSNAEENSFIEKRVVYHQSRYQNVEAFCNEYPDFKAGDIPKRAKRMADEYYRMIQLEFDKI